MTDKSVKRLRGLSLGAKCVILALLLGCLAACSQEGKAKRLGFESVEEMREAHAYLADAPCSALIHAPGSCTKTDLEKAEIEEASSRGFASAEEMKSAKRQGFGYKFEVEAAMQAAETEKLLADYARGARNPRWEKIYSETAYLRHRGGVYVEDNWFGDDKVKFRQARTESYEKAAFVDLNTIVRDGDIGFAATFAEGSNANSIKIATRYGMNCASQTLRKVFQFHYQTAEATKKSVIDQATGSETIFDVPATERVTANLIDRSRPEAAWKKPEDAMEKKYLDVVCKNDLQVFSTERSVDVD